MKDDQRSPGPRTRILVAEDSPTQAQRLRHILEGQGYEVAVATNGREALSIAHRFRPALVISDVVMPEMDGYELAQAIKADSNLQDVPVILVTTMSDPEDVIKGLESGADNFVLKPYDQPYLLGRVRYAILNQEMRRPHDAGIGVEIYFSGQRHFITADRLQILNLLLSTYDAAIQRNKELQRSQDELEGSNSKLNQLKLELEERVKQRTADLQRSEQRFRYAAQATQEVIWDWDLVNGTISFNDALQQVWGYALQAEQVNVGWFEKRIHPDDRARIMQSIRIAIERSDRWSAEFRFQHADLTYGHVIGRAVIIREDGTKAQRAIVTMLDVTQERLAVERVRESEILFRSVAETAGDAIILADLQGNIVFWNAGAVRIFGYSSDEIVGQPVTVLMPERYRSRHLAGIQRVRESGQIGFLGHVLQFEGLRKDRREFPLEMSLTDWRSGGQTFITAVMRDISRRADIERRQRIQLAVVRTLSEATSTVHLPFQLLRNVASEMGWPAAAWWEYDRPRGELRRLHAWTDPALGGDDLLSTGRQFILSAPESSIGHVAITKHAASIDVEDAVSETEAGALASRVIGVGIRHGLALPVLEDGEVTAVVEFLKADATADSDDFLDLLTDSGRRVGEFFKRRRAEERLVHSEASLAEALQIAKLGSFTLDTSSLVVEWSEQTHRIFGLEQGQFDGSVGSYLGRIHPGDRARVSRLITPPLTGASLGFRHRILSPDGEVRWLRCRMRLLEGTMTSPLKLVGTAQDITDEVESEETIRRLSNQNEMILNSAVEGIVGIDVNGGVMFANPAAAALTGWSIEELSASPGIHQVVHPSCEARECPLLNVLADGKPRSGEDVFSRKSGERFPVNFHCSAIVDDGRVIGSVWILEDITTRKRLEHDLDRANRISGLGRVAATIAHEFNNVLMGIQPFAEVIRRRTEDEQARKAAAQIMSSVVRGKRVTQEILRFTQPSDPALQAVDLSAWFQLLLPELQNLVGNLVELRVELPPDPIYVAADPAQLQQVITNLVLNARDAMNGKGEVMIRASNGAGTSGSMASISVRDTGSGMTPAILEQIFEPLYTTKRTGTGLGLAVTQQVIRAHGGSIEVQSAPGEGTTFHIALPRAAARAASGEVDAPSRTTTVRRVVLVEDDMTVAAGIVCLLESEGLSVRAVHTGGEAPSAIEAFKPDVVILDMSLPDMHGTEVHKRIAEHYPSLPILISSGHEDASMLSLNQPRVAFLRKPYDLDALLSTLERIVGNNHTT